MLFDVTARSLNEAFYHYSCTASISSDNSLTRYCITVCFVTPRDPLPIACNFWLKSQVINQGTKQYNEYVACRASIGLKVKKKVSLSKR
jgi:hypothetical protein